MSGPQEDNETESAAMTQVDIGEAPAEAAAPAGAEAAAEDQARCAGRAAGQGGGRGRRAVGEVEAGAGGDGKCPPHRRARSRGRRQVRHQPLCPRCPLRRRQPAPGAGQHGQGRSGHRPRPRRPGQRGRADRARASGDAGPLRDHPDRRGLAALRPPRPRGPVRGAGRDGAARDGRPCPRDRLHDPRPAAPPRPRRRLQGRPEARGAAERRAGGGRSRRGGRSFPAAAPGLMASPRARPKAAPGAASTRPSSGAGEPHLCQVSQGFAAPAEMPGGQLRWFRQPHIYPPTVSCRGRTLG